MAAPRRAETAKPNVFQEYPARWLALVVALLNLSTQMEWVTLTQIQGDAILQVASIVIVIVAGIAPAARPSPDPPQKDDVEREPPLVQYPRTGKRPGGSGDGSLDAARQPERRSPSGTDQFSRRD